MPLPRSVRAYFASLRLGTMQGEDWTGATAEAKRKKKPTVRDVVKKEVRRQQQYRHPRMCTT